MKKTILNALAAVSLIVSGSNAAQAAESEQDFLKNSLKEVCQKLDCAKTSEEKASLLICRAMINHNLGKSVECTKDVEKALLLDPNNAEIATSLNLSR